MLIATVLASLALPVANPAGAPAAVAGPPAYQPVKVWLSRDRGLRRGERVRVYVRVETDGYLAVLHAEPDGRIRMVFPLDPSDDNFLRGGREYELEARAGREAFTVYEDEGVGTVIAVLSRDPFRFDELMRGDYWDYRNRDRWVVYEDAEADLVDLAQLIAVGSYEFDLVRYDIGYGVAYRRGYRPYRYGLYPYYDPFYHRSRFVFGIGFGHRFGFGSCYDAYYDPFYYDPFYCDPFFRRSYYYYRPYYYSYYPYRFYYPYRWRTVFIDNRHFVDRSLRFNRYTFKSDYGRRLADGGIGVRRRVLTTPQGRVSVGGSPAGRVAPPRRTLVRARQPVDAPDRATTGRRVAPDGRRATPGSQGTLERRPQATPRTIPERGRTVRPAPQSRGREVRPERTTPGRREVRPERAPRSRREVAPPRAPTSDRRATPRTPARERQAQPSRSVRPERTPARQQRAVPERGVQPQGSARVQRRPSSSRRGSQADRSDRALRRQTPSRSGARPQATPRLERRSPPVRSPRPSTSGRIQRSNPSARRAPTRQARPSRPIQQAPTRQAPTRQARPSRPIQRAPARAPTRQARPSAPARRAPARSSRPPRVNRKRP